MFFWTTRIDRYVGSFAYFVLAGQLIFCLFIIYFLQHELRAIIREKKKYFKEPWNLAEIGTIILAIVGMFFYGYRYVSGRKLMSDFKNDKQQFLDFHFFAQFDQVRLHLYVFYFVLITSYE